MRKIAVIALVLICAVLLSACTAEAKYKVKLSDASYLVNELKKTYSPGEEVTLKLETIMEHYYIVSVNGVTIRNDTAPSDLEFTYYTFIMPDEDVLIEIEDRWVNIPESPQQ